MTKIETVVRRMRTFGGAKGGTAIVMFAFMAAPLIALVGGMIDYGRAMHVKTELSATLDAAVLAATQAYSLDDSVDPEKIINEFVAKNYSDAGKKLMSSSLVVQTPAISAEGELSATLDVAVPTFFAQLVGVNAFNYSITSAARVGGQSLEVALVLDNTLSMKGDKLAALKTSASTLVDTLMVEGNENVRMALVPFADYVNIGLENRDEPGLDIPADFENTYTSGGSDWCRWTFPNSTQVCTPIKEWGTCSNDGVPYACQKTVGQDCTGDKGEKVWTCTPTNQKTVTDYYKWYGCMGSRVHDLNVRDEDYATGVPGMMSTSNWCKNIAPIVRLTSSKDTLTTGISAMKADRWTYIPGGLAWGWRLLSDIAPFPDGVAYSDDSVKKAIVLMTDGANTLLRKKLTDISTSHHEGEVWAHSTQSLNGAPETDTFTSELCANIKAKGIVVHTIAFDVEEGSSVQTLMKNCAGNGGQYFDADDTEELADAFKKIALALLNLRLSR